MQLIAALVKGSTKHGDFTETSAPGRAGPICMGILEQELSQPGDLSMPTLPPICCSLSLGTTDEVETFRISSFISVEKAQCRTLS